MFLWSIFRYHSSSLMESALYCCLYYSSHSSFSCLMVFCALFCISTTLLPFDSEFQWANSWFYLRKLHVGRSLTHTPLEDGVHPLRGLYVRGDVIWTSVCTPEGGLFCVNRDASPILLVMILRTTAVLQWVGLPYVFLKVALLLCDTSLLPH